MYDVDVLAVEMTDADGKRFDSVVAATIAFRDQLAAARRISIRLEPHAAWLFLHVAGADVAASRS